MNLYRVTLQYPKTTRLSAYCEDIEAESQTLAINAVKLNAPRFGWRATPKTATAVRIQEQAS